MDITILIMAAVGSYATLDKLLKEIRKHNINKRDGKEYRKVLRKLAKRREIREMQKEITKPSVVETLRVVNVTAQRRII